MFDYETRRKRIYCVCFPFCDGQHDGLDTEFTRDLFLWREKHNDSMPAAYIKRSLVCKVCQGHVCVTLWELQLWGSMS